MPKMKHLIFPLCFLWLAFAAGSCSSDKPADAHAEESIPLIILDTDIGSSTDDLFALQAVYNYARRGECRLLGVIVNRMGSDCAALADMMNTYYGFGNVPVAYAREGAENSVVWIDYRNMYRATDASGQPIFSLSVSDYNTLPDGYRLYRRLLAASPDHSVTICSIGFFNCIARLLASDADEYSPMTGVELVRTKVKCLCLMAGVFNDPNRADYNLEQCMEYSQQMMELWPSDVDMVFCPSEVGKTIFYDSADVLADYSTVAVHPIKYVYENYTVDDGQYMWDYITAVGAVEGVDDSHLSPRGTVTLNPDATTTFTPSALGNCRYQLPYTANEAAAVLARLRAECRNQ